MPADDLSADHPPTTADDIELIEMASLASTDTGVDGVIYISTAQASHGPRVKWYPSRSSRNGPGLSASVENQPVTRNLGLSDAVARPAAAALTQWVALNHDALLQFWNDGHTWMSDEVHAFIKRLQKI